MKHCIVFLLLSISFLAESQEHPKLVVGIVVDQMTNDYLYRFSDEFSERGFKRLMNDGHYFPNTFYNYLSTSTGPGHASIYTGCTPSTHGITENLFYDYTRKETVYCVGDESVNGLGTTGDLGKRSPKNLETGTITDMFSLSMPSQAKVIGLAIKDRSAILPAGHLADAAYWWDDQSSSWISSTYYLNNVSNWVYDFNVEHPLKNYLQTWEVSFELSAEEKEAFSFHDQFESPLSPNSATKMPYDLSTLALEVGPSLLKTTPFGNTYTIDFAKKLMASEKMGEDDFCDFLCLSLSSTDYIGHNFGPYSEEIKDTYVKLDNDIGEFLDFLDGHIGENNYILFLTSDHGVVPNIDYLESKKFSAHRYDLQQLESSLDEYLTNRFKIQDILLKITDNQVYMNIDVLEKSGMDVDKVSRSAADYLNSKNDVLLALTAHDLTYKSYTDFPAKEMKASYYKSRSGQVIFTFKNFMRSTEHEKGTGHGTVFNYDRNVPLIFFGKGISKGTSYENVEITQIAATLADLLKIQRPPSCVSESLTEKLISD